MIRLKLKRIYDPPDGTDGARILVERLWPRGVSKEHAALAAEPRHLDPFIQAARKGTVTLVFAAKDPQLSNARALKEFLEKRDG
jgi:uncharacterized protein YeaO (DUF488 family)